MKIGILGPESTGKTTLTTLLHVRHKDSIAVYEYGRTYLEVHGAEYRLEDVLHIAQHVMTQILENNAPYVFFDTELINIKVWLLYKYHFCPAEIDDFLRTYPLDYYLLCAPDIPFIDDPLREHPDDRGVFFQWYRHEIERWKIPYHIITHKKNE